MTSTGPGGLPPVWVLHGQPDTSATWWATRAALRATVVAAGRPTPVVRLPDRPGYGHNPAPATDYAGNVAWLRGELDRNDVERVVLVGHSWGGQVITEAGVEPKVRALVYIAALMPKPGESTAMLEAMKRFPPPNHDVKATADGYYFMDPARFHADFAADSPEPLAAFMAASQVYLAVAAFKAPAKAAAWLTKPSWMVVPTADKTINSDLERWMAARAKAKVTEVPGASHTVFLSHPDLVVSIIEEAAGK